MSGINTVKSCFFFIHEWLTLCSLPLWCLRRWTASRTIGSLLIHVKNRFCPQTFLRILIFRMGFRPLEGMVGGWAGKGNGGAEMRMCAGTLKVFEGLDPPIIKRKRRACACLSELTLYILIRFSDIDLTVSQLDSGASPNTSVSAITWKARLNYTNPLTEAYI